MGAVAIPSLHARGQPGGGVRRDRHERARVVPHSMGSATPARAMLLLLLLAAATLPGVGAPPPNDTAAAAAAGAHARQRQLSEHDPKLVATLKQHVHRSHQAGLLSRAPLATKPLVFSRTPQPTSTSRAATKMGFRARFARWHHRDRLLLKRALKPPGVCKVGLKYEDEFARAVCCASSCGRCEWGGCDMTADSASLPRTHVATAHDADLDMLRGGPATGEHAAALRRVLHAETDLLRDLPDFAELLVRADFSSPRSARPVNGSRTDTTSARAPTRADLDAKLSALVSADVPNAFHRFRAGITTCAPPRPEGCTSRRTHTAPQLSSSACSAPPGTEQLGWLGAQGEARRLPRDRDGALHVPRARSGRRPRVEVLAHCERRVAGGGRREIMRRARPWCVEQSSRYDEVQVAGTTSTTVVATG